MRFGGPIFSKEARTAKPGESHGVGAADPEWLVNEHRRKGYAAAYAPQLSLAQGDEIRAVRKAFADADIMIAEVGYWENLVDLDPDARRINRQTMTDALALAEELGARCAVDIFGSYCYGNGNSVHAARNFSEDAFAEAVDMARYFIDAVKPKTAFFAYEIFPFSVVDTPEQLERLIKSVDRAQFGVHMDLVNLVNCPRAYWDNAAIIRDCVKRFGDRIVASHVKDIKMKEPAISVILEEVPAGQGIIDFGAYMRALCDLPRDIPFMLEHLADEAEYDAAAAHIRNIAKGEGIAL